MKIRPEAKKAVMIGSLCSISYFAVYIARNILSAVTPQMVALGYTEEYVGSISSLYFIFYACGQLINGAIGDKIHAKWMISTGLLGAAVQHAGVALVVRDVDEGDARVLQPVVLEQRVQLLETCRAHAAGSGGRQGVVPGKGLLEAALRQEQPGAHCLNAADTLPQRAGEGVGDLGVTPYLVRGEHGYAGLG